MPPPRSSNVYKQKNRFYCKKCALKSGLPPLKSLFCRPQKGAARVKTASRRGSSLAWLGASTATPEHHLRPMCGQEFLIPYELLLSFLFLHQRLFFACVSLHISVLLSFLLLFLQFPALCVFSCTSPSKILFSSILLHIPLPFFSCTPFSLAFSYPILSFAPVLPMFVPHFPSQNSFEHARSRSLLSVLPSFSIYPSVPYFPVLWI